MMQIDFGLNVEQTQKLIMTPELRQAITILQLSSLELNTYIDQQLQENPLLDLVEEVPEGIPGEEPEYEAKSDEDYDINWSEYFNDSSDLGIPHQEQYKGDGGFAFDSVASKAPTLGEHLISQLHLLDIDSRKIAIGEYLIGNIDHNGYLRLTNPEVAEHLQVYLSEVQGVVELIQTFDPPGVGARNLEECLLLQMRHMRLKDKMLEHIITHHLCDLAKGRYGYLAQTLGVSVKEIQRVADLLKSFDPKPGRNFSSYNNNRYIVPDVTVEKVEGQYIVLINDILTPRLTINSTYRKVLDAGSGVDSGTKRFVESKLHAATWLIRSIEQRRHTLYKVANCLVELQKNFLDFGIKYLKPLNLRKVAEMVDLHESTVSRATSNKYIQTSQGVFEMKFFFSSGLGSTMGNMVSAQSIKKMLEELIESEDAKKPYNDQRISEMFFEKGIKMSRRTVAKYRDELGIPPIKIRKRY